MSRENVEMVRRWIDAWNRRDLTTWLGMSSSDGEIDWTRARGLLKGVYRGHGGLKTFWNEFWATFEDVHLSARRNRPSKQCALDDRAERCRLA